MIPIALAVLAAPAPVPITVAVTGTEPVGDAPYFLNVLDALAPAGLEALPACRRASAGVVVTAGCATDAVEATGQSARARACAEVTVTVKGRSAAECAYELVSAPWPRAIVYAAADGPAAALVWHVPTTPTSTTSSPEAPAPEATLDSNTTSATSSPSTSWPTDARPARGPSPGFD
jgi:hypothetical protein